MPLESQSSSRSRIQSSVCLLILAMCLGMATSLDAQEGNINTAVGGGPTTIPKLSGSVSNIASTGEVGQIAWDGAYQVFYFTSVNFHRVFVYDPVAGHATAFAGTGFNGYGGDGGDISNASFSGPIGLVLDPTNPNYLYVADTGNNRVRRINISQKTVETFLGSGNCVANELTSQDVAAASANLCAPAQMTIDGNGVLYVFDLTKSAVWRVAAGQAHMIAGNGTALSVAPTFGGPATTMSLGNFTYLAANSGGTSLYLNESFGLRKIDLASGQISAPLDVTDSSTQLRDGSPVAINPANGHVIYAIYEPPPASTCDPLIDPSCTGGGGGGPLPESIYDYDPVSGTKTLIVGPGSTAPPFLSPTQGVDLGLSKNGLGEIVAIAPAGGAAAGYIASRSGWIHEINSFAQSPALLTILGNGFKSYCGDGGPAISACLDGPTSVAAAPDGTLYVVDAGNGVIRVVDPAGNIHSLLSPKNAGVMPTAIAVPPVGITYFDPNGGAPLAPDTVLFTSVASHQVFALDPATDTMILYSGTGTPACRALSDGSLFCDNQEDSGLLQAQYGSPVSIAMDSLGNPFVADSDTNLILCLGCTDAIVHVAGGGSTTTSGSPAQFSALNLPVAAIAEPDNGILIAERGGQTVRRVNPDPNFGYVYPFDWGSEILTDVMTTASVGANFTPVGLAKIPGLVLASDAGTGRVMASVLPGSACSAGTGPLQSNVFAGGGTLLADGIPAIQAFFGSKLVEAGVFSSTDGIGQITSSKSSGQTSVYIVDRANNRIRVVAGPTNHPPVANAGPDQTITTGDASVFVTLDGTGSTDPDCDLLSYKWTGADLGFPLIGPVQQVNLAVGVHVFTLSVDDGYGGTSSSNVTITVNGTGPDVSLTATASASTLGTGGNLVYSVTITNNGPGDISNGALTLPITPAALFISGSIGTASCGGPTTPDYGTVICRFGSLVSGTGTSGSITISPVQTGTLSSTLTVTQDQPDSNPTNNSVTFATTVTQGSGGSGGGGGGGIGGGGGSGGGSGTGSCDCALPGPYVDPAQGLEVSGDPLSSPGNKFAVVASVDNTNQFTTLKVIRSADNVVLVPESSYPITAHWGFSPDGNRIAIHAVDSTSEDEMWVYDLSVAPARLVVHYRLPVVSDRLMFSPSGQYFLLIALLSQGRTEIDIYRVAGVSTEDRVFQTAFTFQSVPGVDEDSYGAVNWGFSPDKPESSFVYAYGNGQSTVSLNIANLTSPRLAPVLNGWNISGVAAFWQFNPCGDLLGVVWQPNTSQVEVDLFKTTDGSKLGKSGVTFPTGPSFFVSLASTGASEQATVGFNAPFDLASNPDCDFNTPTGTNVSIAAKDSTTGTTPVTVTFANVTQAGITSVVTGSSGVALPQGFDLGNPATYYEISTTAVFTGTATVCINYSGITFSGSPRLNHYVNGAWIDITSSVDTANHIICGTTTSFSPFALLEQEQLPAITSANLVTFTSGVPGTFAAMTTGVPAPSLSESGSLPPGITFFDNGDGTATLKGNTTAYGSYGITLTATNDAGSVSQSLTLNVNQAPAITSAASATFVAGSMGSFGVTATGFPAPGFNTSGALPTGLKLDSTTGVLSGTPPVNSGGLYPLTLTATNTAGTANQQFLLTVNQAPTITSGSGATFTLGNVGTFTVTSTGFPAAFLAESGTLPTGVSFIDNGNGTGTLTGTPGNSGTFNVTFTANNGVGSPTVQSFTLTVPAPGGPAVKITPASVNFGNVKLYGFAFTKVLLQNTGTSTLSISKVFLTQGAGADRDDFYFLSLCGNSLAPGKSCAIAVAFFADDLGTKSATLSIMDNAAGGIQTVSLGGTAVK